MEFCKKVDTVMDPDVIFKDCEEFDECLFDLVKTHYAWTHHRDGSYTKCALCQTPPVRAPLAVEIRVPDIWLLKDGSTEDGSFWLCWSCLLTHWNTRR